MMSHWLCCSICLCDVILVVLLHLFMWCHIGCAVVFVHVVSHSLRSTRLRCKVMEMRS